MHLGDSIITGLEFLDIQECQRVLQVPLTHFVVCHHNREPLPAAKQSSQSGSRSTHLVLSTPG